VKPILWIFVKDSGKRQFIYAEGEMRGCFANLLAFMAFVTLVGLGTAILAQEAEPETEKEEEYASWDEHLFELGYRLYANSTINVIYGVNLTKEQAVKLRELAKEVEKKGIKKPEAEGKFFPEVQKVRETFMEIQKTFFEKKEVTKELEKKLVEARTLESKILRAGLTAPVFGRKFGSCARCHAEPITKNKKITYDTKAKKWKAMGKKAKSYWVKKEMGYAHLGAILGTKEGFKFMKDGMGKKVAGILTDNQKEVVGSFSCCLVPPKSLSDPVRVGQADVAEWQVKMLEDVRKCSDALWPLAKKRTLDKLEAGAVIADPGMTEEKKREERKRVGDILDKARSLSDVEFKMEKEELAAQIKASAQETPEELRDFNSAFFLLMPGSVEVYDKLIEHLNAEKALEKEKQTEDKEENEGK
jgi:hypothetical protein